MNNDIKTYNNAQTNTEKEICDLLAELICTCLPQAEHKIWHAHPVWFLDGNPIVGYSKLKNGIRLLFWSGQSFNEPKLQQEGSFKAAEMRYTMASQIDVPLLKRWLKKAEKIQWDYKNIVKRKGQLEPLKGIEVKGTLTKAPPYGAIKFTTIDEYHNTFPEAIQLVLQQLRKLIKQAASQAEEVISYNMPAFKQNKVLVYYAAYKTHIGFYPTPLPIVVFKEELQQYQTSKGAIQFPLDEPLPAALIKKIVKFRVKEDVEKAKIAKRA